MGTYPELPSYVLATGEDLQHVINKNSQELFGETVLKKFGHKDLPFLPKVLSIAKALPLQLHPVPTIFFHGDLVNSVSLALEVKSAYWRSMAMNFWRRR